MLYFASHGLRFKGPVLYCANSVKSTLETTMNNVKNITFVFHIEGLFALENCCSLLLLFKS